MAGFPQGVINQTTDLSTGVMDCEYAQPAPPGYFSALIAPSNLPNLLLFFVGVVGIITAVCTLSKIERQISVAERDTQAMVNAERPWLVARIEQKKTGIAGFSIKVENKGRSPAMIVSARIGAEAAEDIFHLPTPPHYGPVELVKDRIVVPGDPAWITWVNREHIKSFVGKQQFEEAMIERKRIIFLFGTILYRDLLDPAETDPHETRWVYMFEFTDEGDAIHDLEGAGWLEGHFNYT
jgi:hypothetical protein